MEGKLKIFTSEWIQDHSEEMLEFLNKSEFVSLFTKKLKLLLFVFFIDKVKENSVYRNGQDDLRYRIEKKKLKNSKTHW